jgi:hypothetical protein
VSTGCVFLFELLSATTIGYRNLPSVSSTLVLSKVQI